MGCSRTRGVENMDSGQLAYYWMKCSPLMAFMQFPKIFVRDISIVFYFFLGKTWLNSWQQITRSQATLKAKQAADWLGGGGMQEEGVSVRGKKNGTVGITSVQTYKYCCSFSNLNLCGKVNNVHASNYQQLRKKFIWSNLKPAHFHMLLHVQYVLSTGGYREMSSILADQYKKASSYRIWAQMRGGGGELRGLCQCVKLCPVHTESKKT